MTVTSFSVDSCQKEKWKMVTKYDDFPQIFDEIATKFSQLLYGPKEGDRGRVTKALDDLNSLNYRYVFVTNPIVSP